MAFFRCFSSLGCPEKSLDETIALAAAHGVPAIELRALGGTIELAAYLARQYGTPDQLGDAARRWPVRIVALDSDLRLAGGTDAQRDALVALAPWADALGTRWLRVFDGGSRADAAELAQAAETMRWWRELRRHRGWQVDVMVETHDSLFTAAAIRRFLDAVPGAAILWDAHHTWKRGGEDPVATWRAVRDSIVHVHVKDSISSASERHPYTYVLPGDGEFPMPPLRSVLQAEGYDGPLSLEWEKIWHPYLGSLDDALRVAGERGWW